jgi:hypothetical protein
MAGLTGLEPATSAVTGQRSKPAELQSHATSCYISPLLIFCQYLLQVSFHRSSANQNGWWIARTEGITVCCIGATTCGA